ncbi:MAG: hypothetical protein M0006_02415 [Magnetospirillum sp.]|nr:hypothetical protein [Magnetospirillum sp.]
MDREFTVGELRQGLAGFPDDAVIHIEDPRDGTVLPIYRVKDRGRDRDGTRIAQVELAIPGH